MGQATAERQADAEEFMETLAYLVENRVPENLRSRLESDDALADRLDYAARSAKIVLSLREDFLQLLERNRGRMPSLMDNRFELRRLPGHKRSTQSSSQGACAVERALTSRLSSPKRPVVRSSGSWPVSRKIFPWLKLTLSRHC